MKRIVFAILLTGMWLPRAVSAQVAISGASSTVGGQPAWTLPMQPFTWCKHPKRRGCRALP